MEFNSGFKGLKTQSVPRCKHYMFWTVSTSTIRSLTLYIQHRTIHVLWLLASRQPQNLYDISDAVCTALLRLIMMNGETVRNM